MIFQLPPQIKIKHVLIASQHILLFFALFILWALPALLNAQQIVSELAISPSNLQGEEQTRYNLLKTDALEEPIKLVSTSIPQNAISNGIVDFTIPGTNLAYKYKCTLFEYSDADNYVWYGLLQRLDGVPTLDRMILVKKDGLLLGEVQTDQYIYKIYPIATDKQMFFKLPNQLSNATNAPNSPSSPEGLCYTDNEACTIRVLIAYTQELANSSLNYLIILNAIMFLKDTNMAFVNSALIKHRLAIADIFKVTDFTEAESDELTRDKAVTHLQTSTTQLYQKKVETKSDIVVVLCKGNWTNSNNFGVSSYGTQASCPEHNNILVSICKYSECQGGRRNFSHEIAHLFSAQHEYSGIAGGSGCTSPRCAYKWTSSGNTYYSLMHGINTGQKREFVYSNNVTMWNGVINGTETQCNAGGAIQKCGCNVASQSPDPVCNPTLGIVFNKPCNPTKATLSISNTSACGSNLKYEFSYSINGAAYVSACPTSSSSSCVVSFTTPPLPSDYLFVRVKITKMVGTQTQVVTTLFGAYSTCPTPFKQ